MEDEKMLKKKSHAAMGCTCRAVGTIDVAQLETETERKRTWVHSKAPQDVGIQKNGLPAGMEDSTGAGHAAGLAQSTHGDALQGTKKNLR